MHFLFGVHGTLDSGTPEKWRNTLKMIRENGHTVCVMTNGFYGAPEEMLTGLVKEEFDAVFEKRNKSFRGSYQFVAQALQVNLDDLFLVDANEENIKNAHQFGVAGKWHRTVEETHYYLNAIAIQKTPG